MPPCLTLSIISYASRVKWSNPVKGVVPSLHLGVVAIEKGAFRSPSTMVSNLLLLYLKERWEVIELKLSKQLMDFLIMVDILLIFLLEQEI